MSINNNTTRIGELSEQLRRAANFLLDLVKKLHPEIRFVPWYIEVIREAADELESYRTVFNADSLLQMIARYLGTTPERLRELVRADNERRLYIFTPDKSSIASYIPEGGFIVTSLDGVVVKGEG